MFYLKILFQAKCVYLVFIFALSSKAQSPAVLPRSFSALKALFSGSRQSLNSASKLPYVVAASAQSTNYIGYPIKANPGNFNQNRSYGVIKNTFDYAEWENPTLEEIEMQNSNSRAILRFNEVFKTNINYKNQGSGIDVGNPMAVNFNIFSKWEELRILKEIISLQKKNEIYVDDFTSRDTRNIRLLSEDGVDLMNDLLIEIRSKIKFYESIIMVKKGNSILKNKEIIIDEKAFRNWFLSKTTRQTDKAVQLVMNLGLKLPKEKSTEKKIKKIDLKKISLSALPSIIQKEIDREIESMELLESSLIALGFIEYDTAAVLVDEKNTLEKEFLFLKTRLEKGLKNYDNELVEDISSISFDSLAVKANNTYKNFVSKIRDIIHEENLYSNAELLALYKEINAISPSESNVINPVLQKKINRDVIEKRYYVKEDEGFKEYTKEQVKIGDGLLADSKNLIKLFPDANLYVEIGKDLASKNQKIKENFGKKFKKENCLLLFFSFYKSKSEAKKANDEILDSLVKMYPKSDLRIIYNRKDKNLRRQLNKIFSKHSGKTFFAISHIENGNLMADYNSNYKLPIDEFRNIAAQNNSSTYLAGCSTTLYENQGTTSAINDLGFATAMARGFNSANSFGDFMKFISNEQKAIKGYAEEVKFIVDEDIFQESSDIKSTVIGRRRTIWSYLTQLFFSNLNR